MVRMRSALLPVVAVLASCGARGGLSASAPGSDAATAPDGDADADRDAEAVPGRDPDASAGADAGDTRADPRVIHRRLCERVFAARADGETTLECSERVNEARNELLPDGGVFESAVVRLDLDSLRVFEIALLGAAYGTFGRRDHDVLDEAEQYLPLGVAPEIWSPDNGSHLIAVRRTEDPAGTVVVSPLLAAQTGASDGRITLPTEWQDAAPLEKDCPSTVTLEACGLDVRTGTELPEELTRAALESVLGTVLPDLIVWGAYIFDAMVVRWAPTPEQAADEDAGELFVVIAGGWLE